MQAPGPRLRQLIRGVSVHTITSIENMSEYKYNNKLFKQ